MEFQAFGKILHIGKLYMCITQKIHGTNAQILIKKDDANFFHIKAGSRTRWLTPENDNHGFAQWVHDNKDELIAKLGEGRHFGEWAGPGINTGEGLKQKTLCLFNWRRWYGKALPSQVTTVPLLYKGAISLDAINDAMHKLQTEGSMLVPGYMRPEGIVIELDGQFYKNVFDDETVPWKGSGRIQGERTANFDIAHLLQPLRLQKLLAKDEAYIRDYPASLGAICKAYTQDLQDENQFISTTEEQLKTEKKALGKEIFYFVKSIIGAMQ